MGDSIQRVAAEAAVSVKTARNILNPNCRHLYSAKTQARVLELARQLGYQPNAYARAVATKRFGSVGLLLSTEKHRSTLPPGLLAGIESALSEHEYHLTIARLPDAKLTSEGFVPKMLREYLCDGLLINYHAAIPPKMAALVRGHKLPSVWVNLQQKFDAVYPDDEGAAFAATQRLLAAGHRRILYVDALFEHARSLGEQHYSKAARLRGYRRAMQAAGRRPRVLTDRPGAPPPPLSRVTVELAEVLAQALQGASAATAVVTYGGEDGLVCEVAARHGLRIPDDVFVVSLCGPDRDHTLTLNPVAGMAIPDFAMGVAAVQMLLRKIEKPGLQLPSICIPFAEGEWSGESAAVGALRPGSGQADRPPAA